MRQLSVLAVLLVMASPARADFTHFSECSERTGANATVVLPAEFVPTIDGTDVEPGDELAVFTSEGLCAGRAVWSGESIAMAVWADDSATPDVDGFVEGDSLQFRIFHDGTVFGENQDDVYISFMEDFDPGTYQRDAIFVVNELAFGKITGTGGGVDENLIFAFESAYPNPFTATATLEYTVSEESPTRLEVFDVLGRRVATLVDDVQAAGRYAVSFQPSAAMSAGMYVVRLQAGSQSAVRRLTLLR